MKKALIASDPDICHGKIRFAGTRIPIYLVMEMLEAGESPQEILEAYPRLTLKHIKAALHFAAEILKNREYVSFV